MVAQRMLGCRSLSRENLFRQVVDVALAPPGIDQSTPWKQLVRNVFNPLRMDQSTEVTAPKMRAGGLSLLMPGVGPLPALHLEYANGGRRLFCMRDENLAAELHAMMQYAMESREAYERGATQERERIALDIHDNIGVQLLGELHSRTHDRKDALIRETLSDLRNIINNASRPGLSLEDTLADLRIEIAEHLSSANIDLQWDMPIDDTPALPTQAAHAMRSVIREATGNVIKHANASLLRIHISHQAQTISLAIEDNGYGFNSSLDMAGNGLNNMRARITGLGGTFDIASCSKGTRVAAQFPMPPAEASR